MNQPAPEFVAFGASHLVALAVFAIGTVVLISLGRRQSDAQSTLFGRIMAVALLAVFVVALFYKVTQPDIQTSVPIQLCDIAEPVAAYALWTRRQWAFALSFFWGLVLSSQALLTPDVGGPDFPAHGFLTFFGLHLLVVWTPIYLTWGRGMRPTWRSYHFTVAATLSWAAITFAFNGIAGTNYGYLNHKPPTPSVLDVLGPWPVYVFFEVMIVIALWALMTSVSLHLNVVLRDLAVQRRAAHAKLRGYLGHRQTI
jgi:hypothetical integral membrane protein (TIGR02206 family)